MNSDEVGNIVQTEYENQSVGLTVTDDAKAHLQSILARHPAAIALRLKIKRSGCSGFMYAPEVAEHIKAGEIEVCFGPELSILVAADDVALIKGTEIAVVSKQLKQKQIIFNNPNAINSCGCGESFAVRDEVDK